jgi:Xaa-Pro dipeptidase
MTLERIQRLKVLQRAAGIDYTAIVPGPNLLYFTGLHMHLSERPIVALIPSDESHPILVAPFFELGKAQAAPVKLDWIIYSYKDGEAYQDAFDKTAKAHKLNGKTIGVEPTQMRVLEWSLLSHAANVKQASAEPIIKQLRMVKDAGEIEAMRKAIRLTEHVFSQLLEEISVGMTERQIASKMMNKMMESGAHAVAFGPLIQSGPNASNPHGVVGDRKIQSGEMLLFDFGLTLDDYSSDLTRTVSLGDPSTEMKQIYELVKAANAAGRAAVKPGVTGADIDRAARKVIDDAGYGEYFTHRTGHGLGLEIHEAPYMVSDETTVLEPGMTFTVEPGIYLPGVGGVRIEDNVVVTETGGESLSSFTRDLLVVGQ